MSQDINEIFHLLPNRSEEDSKLIQDAYDFAKEAHKNMMRDSGEEYFCHLFETSKILVGLGMGPTTVASGFLHDILSDTNVSKEKLEKKFGEEITFLVDGVTKLGQLKYKGADRHNESLRKLFVVMSEDIRVLIIKLADRLHNIRTLEFVTKEKQKRIAEETLKIYAPIAYRLGIRKLNRELEDLAFPYVYPEEYKKIQENFKQKYEESMETLEKFLRSLKKALAKENITNIKTEYRVKGFYSLYKKLLRKDKPIEKIYDMSAVRVLLPEIADCYKVLGIVHSIWRPLPGRIKDYISFPKPNGYQGLHTTVLTEDGNIVEVQIKTNDMQKEAEYGIAAHISYKEGKVTDDQNFDWIKKLLPTKKIKAKKDIEERNEINMDDVPSWIKELVEYQKTDKNDEKLETDLKNDFWEQRIFVFSPKGDVVDLPVGSCPVDYAYAIHSDIGNNIFGAKINDKLVSLDTKLNNGDIITILTKKGGKPNAKWLEYVKTSVASRHIRSHLQKIREKKK